MKIDPKKTFAADMKKYVPVIKDGYSKGLNEASTKLYLSQFFGDVLGYDLLADVLPEYGVKGKFADYAIKIDDEIKLLVEVKQVSLRLKEKHLFQLANYAASEGVEWCLLTNSANFDLYHIEFGKPISWTLVFTTNLIDEDFKDTVDKLWYLTKRSLRKKEIEKYWKKQLSLNPTSIAKAIFTYESIRAIRKALRLSTGMLIDEDELVSEIRHRVIRQKISDDLGKISVRQPAKNNAQSKTEKKSGATATETPAQRDEPEATPKEDQPPSLTPPNDEPEASDQSG